MAEAFRNLFQPQYNDANIYESVDSPKFGICTAVEQCSVWIRPHRKTFAVAQPFHNAAHPSVTWDRQKHITSKLFLNHVTYAI